MSESQTKTYCHIFDKGCHQPWYAEFILANYLVVRNDAGDRMRIVRSGSDHETCGSIDIEYADGHVNSFASLDQAAVDLTGSDTYHYLEDALAIRMEEYAS